MDGEIIHLLKEIKQRIKDDSDIFRTNYNTVDDIRKHIDDCILRIQNGDKDVLTDINIDFAPTSTFQELSIQNGWSDDYMILANKFDGIYKRQR